MVIRPSPSDFHVRPDRRFKARVSLSGVDMANLAVGDYPVWVSVNLRLSLPLQADIRLTAEFRQLEGPNPSAHVPDPVSAPIVAVVILSDGLDGHGDHIRAWRAG